MKYKLGSKIENLRHYSLHYNMQNRAYIVKI